MPGDRLHVLLRYIQEMDIEFADMDEASNFHKVLYGLPEEKKGIEPNPKVPNTRHFTSTLLNDDLVQRSAVWDFAIIDTLT